MLSMTGLGMICAEAAEAGLRIQVEIHSVNRKTLDIQISAPREWSGYEAICSEWINDAFSAGVLMCKSKWNLHRIVVTRSS